MWSSSSSVSFLLKGATQTPAWMARRILTSRNHQTSSRCSLNHHHYNHYNNSSNTHINIQPQVILALDIQRDSIDLARISISHSHSHSHNNDATTVHHQSLDPLKISSRRLDIQTLHELHRHITSCQGVVVHWPLQQPQGRAGGPCGRVWYTLEALVDFSLQQAQAQPPQEDGEPTPLFSHNHRPLCLWTPTTTNSTTSSTASTEDEWGRCALYGRTTPPPHHTTHTYKASVEHYVWPAPPDATQLWHDFCQAQDLPLELVGRTAATTSSSTQTTDAPQEAATSTTTTPIPTPPVRRSCNTLIDWRHAPATAAAAHLEQQQQQQSWAAVF